MGLPVPQPALGEKLLPLPQGDPHGSNRGGVCTFFDFFPFPFLLEFFCKVSGLSSSLSAALGGAAGTNRQRHGGGQELDYAEPQVSTDPHQPH